MFSYIWDVWKEAVKLSLAEDKTREYNRVKIHDSFVVMKLTPELMDEYVERVEVHPDNEIRVIWK